MKDLKLIWVQKGVLILILAMEAFLIIRSDNQVFAIGYMTFIGALFALSTISYDEADNGNTFLFTLPISRKGYVAEKYLFGLLLGGCFWLIGVLFAGVSILTKGGLQFRDLFGMAFMLLPVLFGLLALMFPFQLKFGGEKGRIAIIAAIGMVCIVGVGIEKLARMFHIDLASIFLHMEGMSMGTLSAIVIGIGLVLLYISYQISVAIMNKKEF